MKIAVLTAIATAAVIAVALYLAYLAAQSGSEAPPAEPPTGSPPLNLTERGGVVNYSSYGRFAVELYRRVALQRIDRNLVISPYTVYKAFAMAYAGASGATREEIKRVMGFGEDPCALPRAGRGVEEGVAAWLQADMTVTDSYLSRLRCIGAEVRKVDFKRDVKGALRHINKWVEERTRGLVKGLIPEDYPVGWEPHAVLVSTLFFNGSWWPESFVRVGKAEFGGVGPVEYMSLSLGSCSDPSLRGRVSDDVVVVELLFRDTDVAMYIVMPADFRRYVETLTFEKLLEAVSTLPDEVVSVKMPLFKAEFKQSIKPLLMDMGITDAFSPGKADFSQMVDVKKYGRLYIDDVFHGAFIKADENGVVAGAATGVVVKPICAKAGGRHVVIDKPFIFVLADRSTKTIYFIGHVVDPR